MNLPRKWNYWTIQPTKDHLCGIDRYKDSPARGELVLPIIYLWKRPGAPATPGNLTGALKHGEEVTVHDKRLHKGDLFVRVSAVAVLDGKEYPQKGWVKAVLLETAGLLRPGIEAVIA